MQHNPIVLTEEESAVLAEVYAFLRQIARRAEATDPATSADRSQPAEDEVEPLSQ